MNSQADLNRAIAWAMGEPSGANYSGEDGPARKRFLDWARPQIDPEALQTGEAGAALVGMYGEVVAYTSMLDIMNRWARSGQMR